MAKIWKIPIFFHFLPVNLPIAFCFCSNLVQWTSPWVEHILQVSSSYIQGFLSNHVFQNLKSEIFLWKTVQKCQKRLKTPKTKLVFSLFAISRLLKNFWIVLEILIFLIYIYIYINKEISLLENFLSIRKYNVFPLKSSWQLK